MICCEGRIRDSRSSEHRERGRFSRLDGAQWRKKIFQQRASVVYLKFVEKRQMMVASRIEFKSPFFPFFKGGIFSLAS